VCIRTLVLRDVTRRSEFYFLGQTNPYTFVYYVSITTFLFVQVVVVTSGDGYALVCGSPAGSKRRLPRSERQMSSEWRSRPVFFDEIIITTRVLTTSKVYHTALARTRVPENGGRVLVSWGTTLLLLSIRCSFNSITSGTPRARTCKTNLRVARFIRFPRTAVLNVTPHGRHSLFLPEMNTSAGSKYSYTHSSLVIVRTLFAFTDMSEYITISFT